MAIIGLIIGGVLVGRSLIRSAQVQSVLDDFKTYSIAVQQFKDKYGELPGDFSRATQVWGALDTDPFICAATASTDQRTCNGNDDGKILPLPDNGLVQANSTSNESFRFWQHLANAGLIAGNYDGIAHGTHSYAATFDNSPAGKISNTAWFVWNWGQPQPQAGGGGWFDGEYGNRLSIGAIVPDGEPAGAIFTAQEVRSIDIKLDDGLPAVGNVRSIWPTPCTNAADLAGVNPASAAVNAAYLVQGGDIAACPILFPNAF